MRERQHAVGRQNAFETFSHILVCVRIGIDRKEKATDSIGNHTGKQIRLGGKKPVKGLGGNAGVLRDRADARSGVAALMKLRIGSFDDEALCIIVAPDLRATPRALLDLVNYDHPYFPKYY